MDEQTNNQQPRVIEQTWQHQSGQLEQPDRDVKPTITNDGISWSASEFVSHEKSAGWYILLVLIAILLGAGIYFVTHEVFSVIVVAVLAIALGVFGALKPRTLEYAINGDGIAVGNKHFPFDTFRSFAIIEDAVVPSIQLLPQKRFMVPITIYLSPDEQDKVLDILSQFLPFERKKRDAVDKITARIRF